MPRSLKDFKSQHESEEKASKKRTGGEIEDELNIFKKRLIIKLVKHKFETVKDEPTSENKDKHPKQVGSHQDSNITEVDPKKSLKTGSSTSSNSSSANVSREINKPTHSAPNLQKSSADKNKTPIKMTESKGTKEVSSYSSKELTKPKDSSKMIQKPEHKRPSELDKSKTSSGTTKTSLPGTLTKGTKAHQDITSKLTPQKTEKKAPETTQGSVSGASKGIKSQDVPRKLTPQKNQANGPPAHSGKDRKIEVISHQILKKASGQDTTMPGKTHHSEKTTKDVSKAPPNIAKILPDKAEKTKDGAASSSSVKQIIPATFAKNTDSNPDSQILKSSVLSAAASKEPASDIKETTVKKFNPNEKRITTFYCNKCGLSFDNFEKLHEHIFKIPDKSHVFRCANCQYIVGKTLVEVMLHTKRFCSREEFKQSEEEIVKKHPDEKRYYCERCGKGFGLLADLLKHYVEHTDEALCCSSCDKRSSNFLELMFHFREHTLIGNINLPCKLCPLVFYATAPSKLHYYTAHFLIYNVPFECDLCVNVIFDDEEKFLFHVQGHCKINTDVKPGRPKIDVNKLTCEVCAQICQTAGECKRHKTEVHKLGPDEERNCPQCKKNITISGISSHLLFHQKEKAAALPKNTHRNVKDSADSGDKQEEAPAASPAPAPPAKTQALLETPPTTIAHSGISYQAPFQNQNKPLLQTPPTSGASGQGMLPTSLTSGASGQGLLPTPLTSAASSQGILPTPVTSGASSQGILPTPVTSGASGQGILPTPPNPQYFAESSTGPVRTQYSASNPTLQVGRSIAKPPLTNQNTSLLGRAPLVPPSTGSQSSVLLQSLTLLNTLLANPKCTECDKTFASVFALNEHMNSHALDRAERAGHFNPQGATRSSFSSQSSFTQGSHFYPPQSQGSAARSSFPQQGSFAAQTSQFSPQMPKQTIRATPFLGEGKHPIVQLSGLQAPKKSRDFSRGSSAAQIPLSGSNESMMNLSRNDPSPVKPPEPFKAESLNPWLGSTFEQQTQRGVIVKAQQKTETAPKRRSDNPWLSNESSSHDLSAGDREQRAGTQWQSSNKNSSKNEAEFLEWCSYEELDDQPERSVMTSSGFVDDKPSSVSTIAPSTSGPSNLFSRQRMSSSPSGSQFKYIGEQSTAVNVPRLQAKREGRPEEHTAQRRQSSPSPMMRRGDYYSEGNVLDEEEEEESYLDNVDLSISDGASASDYGRARGPSPTPMRRRSRSRELGERRQQGYERRDTMRSRSRERFQFSPPPTQRRRSPSPRRELDRSRSPFGRNTERSSAPFTRRSPPARNRGWQGDRNFRR